MSWGLGVVRNIAVRGNCGFQLEHCIDRILMQDLSCSRGKVLQKVVTTSSDLQLLCLISCAPAWYWILSTVHEHI